MDKNNRFINEEEAYYLSAILNTDVVQEYFKFTFSERSYSIDFNIKMPLYDSENEIQKEMATLAKQAHEVFGNDNEIKAIKEKLEELYIALCDTVS